MSTKRETRYRNFATVVYPESAPEGWQDILSEYHIPAFISPLHDKDISVDGSSKKAHYHVILMYDAPTTKERAQSIFESIGGVGLLTLQVLRSYARYLCHLDDPNKVQYNVSDVKELSGSVYHDIISSSADRYQAFGEMIDFCEQYNVSSFYLLSRYARINRSDWYRILCDSGTVFMKEFLKSREWSLGKGFDHIIDQETGEIIL